MSCVSEGPDGLTYGWTPHGEGTHDVGNLFEVIVAVLVKADDEHHAADLVAAGKGDLWWEITKVTPLVDGDGADALEGTPN